MKYKGTDEINHRQQGVSNMQPNSNSKYNNWPGLESIASRSWQYGKNIPFPTF